MKRMDDSLFLRLDASDCPELYAEACRARDAEARLMAACAKALEQLRRSRERFKEQQAVVDDITAQLRALQGANRATPKKEHKS